MNEQFLGRCERCSQYLAEEDLTSVDYNGVEEVWDYGCIDIARNNGEEVTELN